MRCSIIPPHILRNIAERGAAEERARAQAAQHRGERAEAAVAGAWKSVGVS